MYTKSEKLVVDSDRKNVKDYLIFVEKFLFGCSPWGEFVDHLATIRLDEERIHQYPPKIIILETARILFKAVRRTLRS